MLIQLMKKACLSGKPMFALTLGALLAPWAANAQFFSYNSTGDTLLGFRKTGTHQGNYELVVNIGSVTNLIRIPAGQTINITNFNASQLSDAFADGFQNLQWSACAGFPGSSSWAGYPKDTLWYSAPATNSGSQSVAPARFSVNAQAILQKRFQGLGQGAVTMSSSLGTTDADNNSKLVREPFDPNNVLSLTYYIGDPADSTIGDWGGQVISPAISVENVTPTSFSTSARLDFYQSVPSGYVDPTTGSTGANAYLVGYFLLNTSGTMTFTRGSAVTTPPPPPPSVLSAARSGNTTTIFFTTTNGATYTLYYTNAAGLNSPVSTWAVAPTTVTGDGTTKSLTDTSTDGGRFYSIGAH